MNDKKKLDEVRIPKQVAVVKKENRELVIIMMLQVMQAEVRTLSAVTMGLLDTLTEKKRKEDKNFPTAEKFFTDLYLENAQSVNKWLSRYGTMKNIDELDIKGTIN